MAQLTLEAQTRSVVGKKVKTLRREGKLPANVYGHNVTSQALEVDAHAFHLLERRLPANAILQLVVDGAAPRSVMLHRTQRNVRTGLPTHLELFQVNLLEKLTANVPIVITGEPEPVRRGEAILLQELNSIEMTSLPADLPSALHVHVEGLAEVGAAIYVRDLNFNHSKVETKVHLDDLVVILAAPQMAPEAEDAAPAVAPAAPAE